MKPKKNEFVVTNTRNLHVLSLKSQKKFKKLSQKVPIVSEDKKSLVLKQLQGLKLEESKQKLKKKLGTRTAVMKSPLVISMPSTSQTSTPHLLTCESSESIQSQLTTYSGISELMTPKHNHSDSETDDTGKRKRIVKLKKLKKPKFQVEDVVAFENKTNESNMSISEISSPRDHSLSFAKFTDPRAKFYELDDSKVLLTIQQSCSIYICGIITVSVLSGAIEVLGFNIEPDSKEYTVFSPSGSSLLCLTSVNRPVYKNPTVNELITLGLKKSVVDKVLNDCTNDTAFAVLKKGMTQALQSKFMNFVERYAKRPIFTEISNKENPLFFAEKILDCALYHFTNNALRKEYTVIPSWLQIKEDLLNFSSESNAKIVLCGGKAVGKSTLLRYFVNTMLKKFEKVVVIDCDIGQSEFTIPGCVSVVIVNKPLLGPSYTHFIKPKRCVFLGEVSVTQCAEKYFESVQYLFDYCSSEPEFKNVPWFVNTMGFNRGFGVMLTSCLIQRFGPTHLVQINSKDKHRNFPSWLTPAVVDHQDTGVFTTAYNPLNYQFYVVQSAAEYKDGSSKTPWGLHPPVAREVLILSYVALMLKPPAVDLNEIVPYEVNFADINVELTKETLLRDEILSTMNGCLVAMCQTIENMNLCLGFGIVRGVDLEKGKLYVITPLSANALKTVNTLVKSGYVELPESVYRDQENNIFGPVPYVSFTSGRTPTLAAKKTYRPYNDSLGTHIKDY